MISVKKATDIIESNFLRLNEKKYSILDLNKKTIKEDIFGERDQPPFDRVTMDGIAIAASSSTERFEIQDIQSAGIARKKLFNSRYCIEVMTGSPLPEGTDTVVPYEEIIILGKYATLKKVPTRYQNIHFKGSDSKEGEVILPSGSVIRASELAVLVSQGKSSVLAFELPKVAIISTGDELVEPGNDILDYQIRRSNPYTLYHELNSFGFEKNKLDLFHFKEVFYKKIVESLIRIVD